MKGSIILLFPLAALVMVQCKKSNSSNSNNPSRLAPYDSLRIISLSGTSIEADSASTCLITVHIAVDDAAGPTDGFVIFHTSLGNFPNGLQTDTVAAAGANLIASIPLLSDTLGTAMITATVDGFSKDTAINFIPSLPDDMLCSANAYTGTVSAGFSMSCSLYRNPGRGKVTDPAKVSFGFTPATGANGAPALIVPTFAYSVRGVVNDTIENPYQNTGNFSIQATTPTYNGGILNRSITIVIN